MVLLPVSLKGNVELIVRAISAVAGVQWDNAPFLRPLVRLAV